MAHKDDVLVQITDYLFDKGFSVNKPMMEAIAEWVAERDVAIFNQGRIASERDTHGTK